MFHETASRAVSRFFVLLNKSDFEGKSPSCIFCMIRRRHVYLKKSCATEHSENCTRLLHRVRRNIGSGADLCWRVGRGCFDLGSRGFASQLSIECLFLVRPKKWW